MLKELFEAISRQAIDASQPRFFKADGEPAHVYWSAFGDKPERVEALPASRAHKANSLPALVACVKDHITAGEWATVWYARSGVVALMEDSTRRDRVTMPLALSPQVKTMLALEQSQKELTQKDLLRLLRISLKGCVELSLIETLRSVKFTANSDGRSEISQGKSSIGKRLETELTGVKAIPEYVTVSLPVFAGGFAHMGNIQAALEVNPDTATFQVIPCPGEIERTLENAEDALGDMLRDLFSETEEVKVYHGEP